MPQGKTKPKAKVPKKVAAKKKGKAAVHGVKRANAPKPKKSPSKVKKAITKAVNASAEEKLRAAAFVTGRKAATPKKATPKKAAAKKTKRK